MSDKRETPDGEDRALISSWRECRPRRRATDTVIHGRRAEFHNPPNPIANSKTGFQYAGYGFDPDAEITKRSSLVIRSPLVFGDTSAMLKAPSLTTWCVWSSRWTLGLPPQFHVKDRNRPAGTWC
ncbi:hypothetical protein FA13DRAFT_1094475 [Coprinellus micaceus]|uniref:Uncharacterized protein n=1 Tax=Coprinellus micaceus TaxID=71717 RepID=A0A4Y7TTV4_COPMI|nr:hypothetical protein FA13DRAFT_1094475 [Coprinellus micaceus]